MGHQIGKRHRPRRGSLQYWPRKRAKRPYSRVKTYPDADATSVLGFAGYKVGMTHILAVDNRKNSITKGEEISMPVTVIEAPNLKVMGVRYYKNTTDGLKAITQKLSPSLSKELQRKITLPSSKETKQKEAKELSPESVHEVALIVHTQPKLAGVSKKKPEIFEIPVAGKDTLQKIQFADSILGNEIKVSDVFKPGEQIDIVSVTKGKGFQGSVKRFGVKLLSHKREKGRRKIGSHGAWHPAKIVFQTPMPGQMGYHARTEFNKWLVKIGENPEEINVKGGFLNYGLVKSNFILLKGSVAGPRKRLIRFRKAVRPSGKIPPQPPEVVYVSKASKQGA
ncbi:MAG: 50S ribosomal protein L3 [Candidatus Nanoarchaeia archaeon]|nr:50S ribosomal protein L3 [Candidatus Nanoarchaeia archaeon]